MCAAKLRVPVDRNSPIDHCHETGYVRGVLCAMHNKGLGHFHDSVTALAEAISYLERAKAMANFAPICTWLLRQEDSTLSGKIGDLHDGAGLTRFGLTTRDDSDLLPANFWTDEVSAQDAEALAIPAYKQKYWDPFHGDGIAADEVAASIFSFCVNGGELSEIHIFQRAFGLNPDGVVGPATLAAWNSPGAGDRIRQAQLAHYNAIYNTNPAHYQQWINGWRKRALRVYPSLA